MPPEFGLADFAKCIREIVEVSDDIQDSWQHHETQNRHNGRYITKRVRQVLRKNAGQETGIIVAFEYHVVYNINYAVPVLCFIAWKQDGSLLQMEEYCEYNDKFRDSQVLNTLTQLDHPVLCRPFLTLHPCRTQEIIEPFLINSKNPVVSWLTVVAPFLDLKIDNAYIKLC